MNNENRIAVVGMGGLFPDAENLDVFWQNILSKRVSIRPVPKQILDAEIFFRPDLFQAIDKQDKSITKLAGLNQLGKIFIRRGQHPHIHLHRGYCAEGLDNMILQHPQQPDL